MYRGMAWWMLRHGVDVNDPAAVAAHAGDPLIESGTNPLSPTIAVDGIDVATDIRSDEVTRSVSPVSAVPEVRTRLLDLQRAIIAASPRGIVVEGRDIGSAVAPDAPVKVYLTADPVARAIRRAAEEGVTDVETTQESLLARDKIDSGRATSPLVMAEGSVHIDTTGYTLDEVIDLVVGLVGEAAA
jgi:cytidylate kinase